MATSIFALQPLIATHMFVPRYHIKLFSEKNAPYFTEMTLHRQFHGDVTSTHYKVICEKSSIFVSKKMVLHVLKHDQGYKKCNLQSNFTEKNLEPSKVAILRTNTPLRYRFKPVHWSSIGGANESLTIQFQAFFSLPQSSYTTKKTCLSNSFSHSGFNLSCLCHVASNHGREKKTTIYSSCIQVYWLVHKDPWIFFMVDLSYSPHSWVVFHGSRVLESLRKKKKTRNPSNPGSFTVETSKLFQLESTPNHGQLNHMQCFTMAIHLTNGWFRVTGSPRFSTWQKRETKTLRKS